MNNVSQIGVSNGGLAVQNMHVDGTLHMLIKEGVLFRNTELFGKMDPYIEIIYNGETYKTKPAAEAGTNPKWNAHMLIPIQAFDEAHIKFKCFDEDLISNDFIGEASFKATSLIKVFNEARASKLILNYQHKPAAEI